MGKNKITINFSAYNNKQTAYQIGAIYKSLGYKVFYSY